VQLAARSDTACITAQPAISNPESLYQLQLSYRTLAGRPARICVWEVGPNLCAATPTLTADPAWRTITTPVPIDPGTSQLQLYLYADGQSNPETTVAYRDVTLTRSAPVSIIVTPLSTTTTSPRTDPPTLNITHVSPTVLRLTVHGVHQSTNLILAESFTSGWALTGLPPGWTAQHFEANGYANGWQLHGSGDAHLTLSYTPQHLSTLALRASLLTLLGLLCTLTYYATRQTLTGRRTKTRRRRRTRTAPFSRHHADRASTEPHSP
jgi:arabinofuranan 3-O-arabinosyltransferase